MINANNQKYSQDPKNKIYKTLKTISELTPNKPLA